MNFDLRFYWTLFLRRLPVMSLFILLFSGLGLVTAYKLPETFSTSARLLFESPQIPDSMVRSTVQTGAAEQLDIIQQKLMTRANLIDIANRFNVFEDIRSMTPDAVVTSMRAATSIRRRGGSARGEAATMMTIGFEGRAPQIVANVVNEYVTLVLQENSRFRVSRAESTLDFFEQEVARLDDELSRKSVEIAEFKSENAAALPQDQAFRLGRRSLLQDRIATLERQILAAETQREALGSDVAVTTRISSPNALEQQLLAGQAELARLREDYSESNPRVIRLRERMDRLQAVVNAGNPVVATEGVDGASRREAQLDAARSEIDKEIVGFREQIEATKAELEELAKNISTSSSNALQLAELERDYQVVQARYNSAVSNLNSARMGERIEATAQGQRISVFENASVPQLPSGPDRILIAAIGISIGVGLAVAYFALLEVLNRSIRRPAELSERFDVLPIATIPYMESRTRKFVRRGARMTATLAVLIGVPTALWYVDSNYLPLEVIVQRGLDRLGLG